MHNGHNEREDCTVARAAVKEHGPEKESLLPILQQIDGVYSCLPNDSLRAAAEALKLSDAEVYSVASFYSMLATEQRRQEVVRICDGPVCSLLGATKLCEKVKENAMRQGLSYARTSCLGICDRAPAALVGLDACGPLQLRDAENMLVVERKASPVYAEPSANEVRVALQRAGKIDPDEIDDAISANAYSALAGALDKSPEFVGECIQQSGLQGRGGAGFPTGTKWKLVAEQASDEKYVICNADESEPCSFKDRVLLENDPHLLLEGMALAGYAVGARQGLVYIRGEFELAARRLERAIEQAEQRNWLGARIQGSDFDFHVALHRGAGAYICGEESALIESLEGNRGEPRVRPPYPTSNGFRGRPTVVNNVETLCHVPPIVSHGPEWYRSMGTGNSPGTKLFTVTGHVRRPGAFEAPFGITLREVIEDFGGGMLEGSQFKMALTGGAAGTIVGSELLDVPLDFSSHKKGISLGAGSIFVLDDSVSVLTLLGWLLHFFELESCGKCTPCREGTRAARIAVHGLQEKRSSTGCAAQLRRLSAILRQTSMCGLGQSVSWPIDSAMAHFPDEFK